MANPAPTITVFNAFDVNVGTIIDFNIVGGTNIVRSNKLYVYDLNNELIFTHLYISTESIHELPAKTDSSIMYASGKTSADFVNEQQYYACIQTFTNISGTDGGSGYSTAKLFWALPTPSLSINEIPASIDITSYNIIAMFDTNIISDLGTTNIIQQYKFDLYKSTGVLIQTSGIIVGNGEQIGTSSEYRINYNFNNLEDLSSYYVITTITTAEGMVLSDTSSTFTVNIDAPTLGEATVVNNACDGYISITSNLSASYTPDITKILVKRLDKSDITQTWLTLFSIDINTASDMDFTVIDFYNCYGKRYQYALVPIILQNQSGINVEVEGGYTLSNIVESVFDGVFIADNTAIQKLQAGVGYNSISVRQDIGVIETIGNKYPIIVSNNNLNYRTGAISANIFHEGFYSSTTYPIYTNKWSRTAMVSARKAMEKFLTNKSPKILKDWNGNIWLVMFTSDVNLSFTNEWGMGIASFDATWTEVGDAEDQYDLQNSGLINIGGV